MREVTIWLPYEAPGLNQLLDKKTLGAVLRERGKRRNRFGRFNKSVADPYAQTKAQWNTRVWAHVHDLRIEPFANGAHVAFEIHEKDRRRDPDGFTSGAAKVVLDGLVKARVLNNDGWHDVLSLSHTWLVSDRPGIKVILRGEP
jgi:hypothetical protein